MSAADLLTAELRLQEATTAGDAQAARALVGELLDQGVGGRTMILDLLVPAQRTIGLRWQRGDASVADEHAATAVVDSALAALEANASTSRADGPVLAVTCAESEWHALPARMAAQLFRESGAQVRFLGPSMPADHLREYLARLQPVALLLSATMTTSLPGAARSIEAAHDAGVPVVTGGAAFGGDAALSTRLGADGWLATAGATTDLALQVTAPPSALAWQEFLRLEHEAPRVIEAAQDRLRRRPGTTVTTVAASADLQEILCHLAISLLVGEDVVLRDFTSWHLDVQLARGVPGSVVAASYLAVAAELDAAVGAVLIELAEGIPSG